MPLPKPKKNESEDDWIARCMGNKTMNDEYTDNDQRLAICHQIWRDKDKNSNSERELRILQPEEAEMRVIPGENGSPGKLVGYAARFNKDSEEMWGVIEQIKPKAFSEALKTDDVRALINHDPNLLLGRTSAGTLNLSENTLGLKYEIDLPDTQAGRDIVQSVERGDINGSSFAFTTKEDKWNYEKEPVRREVLKVARLFDIGPVTYPAYPDTSVVARSLVEHLPRRKPTEPDPKEAESANSSIQLEQDARRDKRRAEKVLRIKTRLEASGAKIAE